MVSGSNGCVGSNILGKPKLSLADPWEEAYNAEGDGKEEGGQCMQA